MAFKDSGTRLGHFGTPKNDIIGFYFKAFKNNIVGLFSIELVGNEETLLIS